ncbi:MAG: CocE/NonD family hydrolase [Bacteroidetes bacterium]|jgi:predicted acyl esterase|nr:CocE/NonD family hydrolase [Bacteroidota bacterium]
MTTCFPNTLRLKRLLAVTFGFALLLLLGTASAYAQAMQHEATSVTMDDGAHLAADVYRPSGPGPFPTVLIRTPYGRRGYDEAYAPHFIDRGYALVVQSVRGTGGSDGAFVPFLHERRDGLDTVEWLVEQPWCSGDVGLYGTSYLAYAALLLAGEGHPAVRAVANVSGWAELTPMLYPGGAFHLQLILPWNLNQLGLLRKDTDWDALFRHTPLREAIRLPDGTVHPGWAAGLRFLGPEGDLAALGLGDRPIDVPVLHLTGWHDFVYRGTLAAYDHIQERADVPQRLIVGPWYHDQQKTTQTQVGDVDFGPSAALGWARMHAFALDWFDRWMQDQPAASAAPVRLFVMGENAWSEAETWPPAEAAPTRWYLTSDGGAHHPDGGGTLRPTPPSQSGTDTFTYDPNDPVPTVGGVNFHFFPNTLGPRDQRSVEARDDVLSYTTAPLDEPIDLVGPLRAVLYASTNRPDADVTAKLVLVRPDGYARIVEDGIVRLRYRHGLTRPTPLTPGTPVRLEVDLGATALHVPVGSRLRLDVSGGNFPKYDRNPGDGTLSIDATRFHPNRQTIHHGPERASFLEVYARPAASSPPAGAEGD